MLQNGDLIGIIAPAGAPQDLNKFEQGRATLSARGYRIAWPNTFDPQGYLANTDTARLAELNRALADPDVKALFCARGGYGTLRLLPHLDYAKARQHPKILIGYSDITALQCALYHKAGWQSLSGPMIAVEWPEPDPASEAHFWSWFTESAPRDVLGPHGEPLAPMQTGTAQGPLLGGNLSLIAALIGTPYLPSLDGAILFLEDVGEPPYRIDGLLMRLKLSGIWDRLGGVVLGGFTGWEKPKTQPPWPMGTVLADYFHDAPFPVANNLIYGHFPTKSTLPIGVQVRLVVTEETATLTVLESLGGCA